MQMYSVVFYLSVCIVTRMPILLTELNQKTGLEVIKKFMHNSAEHGTLNAHKYENIKKFSIFSGSDKPRMLFFPLINVKMPTFGGILIFLSRKNFKFR